ncbi:MAG: MFS transporter [Massiliimalia sp.]|jgi:PPP family 3-phenylpropionic acid transporter
MNVFRRFFYSTYFCRENILFYLLNVVYYGTTSIYFGFLVMFLTEKGYSSFECGLFNTLVSIASLVVQPLAGYLTDTYITIKKYLIIASIAAIVFTFSLPLTVQYPVIAACCTFFMSAVINPCAFLADTWAVTLREDNPNIDYGKNRSGGSVGYFLVSIIAGELIAPFGYNTLFIIHMILFAAYLLIVLQIPSVPCRNRGKSSEEQLDSSEKGYSFPQIIGMLFHNKAYCLFLFSAVFYFIGMRAFSANVTYKVLALNGGDSEMGAALAIGAIFEVPFLFIINYCIHRFKLSYLYLLCVSFIVLRGILMAAAPIMSLLYVSQILQACSYGIYVAVSLEIVSRIVPPSIRATSITFMVAMTSGLAAIIGIFFGGILIDQVGVDLMCWIMTLSSFLGLLIYLFPVIKASKKAPENIL